MSDSPVASPLEWEVNRPKKKGPEYYNSMKECFGEFIEGNELLPVSSVMEVVNKRTIFLLNTDAKILARISNAMWDVLLESEDEVKSLAKSIMAIKAIRIQTEYMGT